MKIIKESLALLLTAALLFGLLPGQPLRAYAAETEQPATVSVENSVFTVTPAVSIVCPGSELTLTVSISGNNTWSSLGYIPVSDSDVFEVISGEVLPLGQEALINDFSITDGGVLLYSEPIARSGDLFSFTIHIKEDAPVGEYTVSNTAAIKNGSEVIPFILNDALITVCTEPSEEIVAQGTCGENLTWTLNEEGVLGVSGSGDMYNYCAPDTYAPWHDHAASITSIIIEDGVTSIGEEAFRGCEKAISVTIPASVTDIGAYAFGWCYCLTKVAIPDSVTSIALCAFYNCQNLTDITIGTGVTTIGVRAFENCLKLKSIIIPDSVVSIGSSAFQDCYELTSITIGTGVTNIGNYAFDYCYALEEVVFNAVAMNDLATANYVFRYAGEDSGGVAVTIGPDVTKIPAYLFCPHFNNRDYDAYVTSITFAEGSVCKSIGAAAFLVCKSPSLTLPDGLTDIGEKAFYMSRIDGELIIPDSVTDLGHLAFQYCRGIKKLVVGNGITEIGASEFRYCTALESVVIPEGICSIGQYAFAGCTKLTNVEIPCSVTTIGMSCFGSSLTDVYYAGTQIQWDAITIDSYNDALTNASIHCAEPILTDVAINALPTKLIYEIGDDLDTTGLELIATYHDGSSAIISEDISVIHNSEVFKSAGTKSIAIIYEGFILGFDIEVRDVNQDIIASGTCGDDLTWTLNDAGTLTISGTGALRDYYNPSLIPWNEHILAITSVVIEDGVTSIGQCAFENHSNLTRVTLADSITNIGNWAFNNCPHLTDVLIGKHVTNIGRGAFASCIELSAITFPNSVISIGDYAFSHCTSLTAITIPDSVVTIGVEAFYWCVNLTSVTLGEKVTNIGDYAFSACGLTSIIIPYGLKDIGNYVFLDCCNLAYVSIPDSVTSIGEGAFCNCNLSSIAIPKGITSVGNYAFSECGNLTDVYYGGSATQWKLLSFGNGNAVLTRAKIHYAARESVRISINTLPNKTAYIVGESLETSGLTLILTYDDSSAVAISEGFTVTGFDSSVVGTQTLTVFYEDLSTTFEVKVEEPAPEIITQPGDVEITAGFTAQFTVEAANAAFYKWQYRRNETAPWVNTTMSGYATATLTVPAILGRDGYQYRCCVTGNDGTVLYTEPATLTVNDSIIITSQPSRQIVCVDANATFTVEADGAGLTYQWLYRKNADDFWKVTGLTGNKTNTLTVPALAGRNGYQYRCAITDENGIKVYSNAATLSAIGFTSHPADQIATVGAHAVFTVTAKGQNLSYQWQYRKAEDGNWMTTSLTGAQTDTLTVGVLASRNGYQYRCVITDINGVKVYSDAATLTVK